MDLQQHYLKSVRFEFERYKYLGDNTFAQLDGQDIHWTYHQEGNSVALIVKHMVGNMLSRWTNFLTEDGEKPWRHREMEFEAPPESKEAMLVLWEKGWNCLFDALASINRDNFGTTVKIRDEDHTVVEAVNRQLAHYANHVGQIVLMGKMIRGSDWLSLSIPKGGSARFNAEKFSGQSK